MRYLAFVVALFVFACGEDPDPTPNDCPVGTFGDSCAPCDPGFFCDGKGEALACADGAWDDDADPATPCVSWSTCQAGSAPQGGSSTSDVGCEPCPNGTFSGGSAACTNWTECVAGQWLVAEGNAESDRRCQICSVLEYDHDSDPATACVSCDLGYRATTDRLSCVNTDECADNSAGCAQNCTDTDGSFTCSCNNGYTLASDDRGCDGNTYTVTLHYEDGDTANTTLQVTFGAPYGTLPELMRTGYDFDGWWTASGGSGSQAHAITEVVIAEHHQLYAHWVFTRSLSVSAGAQHTCVVESDGTVWCTGRNIVGELGDGTTTPSATPVQVLGLTGAKTVSVGNLGHTCALKVDGSVWCWGNNGLGRLGDGTTTHSAIPVQVQGLTDVTDLSAGSYHTCAAKTDGSVWCWGGGSYGQLGDGTSTQKTPVQVPGLTGATALSAGYFYTCAVKSDQTVWCWGNGQYGQLGNGNTNSTRLGQVAGLTDVKAVSAGYRHACALKADQRVWCWGANWSGQLGDGTIRQKNTPVLVSGLGAKAVSAGNNFTCAVKTDGSTWCWGDNDEGQLGDGTTTKSRVPVPALGLTQATGVSAGESHACVVKMDGSTWCWGENRYGQLARLSPAPHNLPGQVDGLNADVLTLNGKNNHTCAVKIDGTVWCWGRNDSGQLGDGSTTTSVTPVQVIGLAGAVDVSFGGSNCALMSDETVWCWGSNGSGQLAAPLSTVQFRCRSRG